MPRYDPTQPRQAPATRTPFPGDHLRRAGKGRRRAEPPPPAPPGTSGEPAAEGGKAPMDETAGTPTRIVEKPDAAPAS